MPDGSAAPASWSVDEVAEWVSGQPIADVDAIVRSFRAEEVNGEALLQYASTGRKDLKDDFQLSIGKASSLWKAISELASNVGAAASAPHQSPSSPNYRYVDNVHAMSPGPCGTQAQFETSNPNPTEETTSGIRLLPDDDLGQNERSSSSGLLQMGAVVDDTNAAGRAFAQALVMPHVMQLDPGAAFLGLRGEQVMFGSLCQPVPPEAHELCASLLLRGVYLKFMEASATDEEATKWIHHADTFVVFGDSHYGTEATTCTQLFEALQHQKKLILINFLQDREDFERSIKPVLNQKNMLRLKWKPGTPMPIDLVGRLLRTLDVPSKAKQRMLRNSVSICEDFAAHLRANPRRDGYDWDSLLAAVDTALDEAKHAMSDEGERPLDRLRRSIHFGRGRGRGRGRGSGRGAHGRGQQRGTLGSTSMPELSHGTQIVPTLEPDDDFDLVFSNKTMWDPLCLDVRDKLSVDGVRIWQQQTNIPKDSDNWFNEWYPSAVKARKIVCFISADYLRSPYCMKEFDIAVSTNKLLVVACEPVKEILAVDVEAYPHCSNAHAYLVRGGQVIFNGQDDIVSEVRKFLA